MGQLDIQLGKEGMYLYFTPYTNIYPKSIKNLYFNETLTEYYEQTGGEIGAKTQHIRFPYDDSENGNFFSDHLVVIDGADQLQISIRLNVATIDAIEEKYKLEGLSRENLDYLSYRLVDNEGRVLGAGGAVVTDKAAMYGVAYNLATLLNFILNAINNSYVPWFYGKIKEGKPQENKLYHCGYTVFCFHLFISHLWE